MSNEEVPCRIAAGSAQRSLSASLDNATPRRALCHRKGAWWMVKDQWEGRRDEEAFNVANVI